MMIESWLSLRFAIPGPLLLILRCVGILCRRDVELDMFSQSSILKKGAEGVLAVQASILKKGGGGGTGRSCENSSNNRWTKIMLDENNVGSSSLIALPTCVSTRWIVIPRLCVCAHTIPRRATEFRFLSYFSFWLLRLLLALGNEISRIG